MRIILPRCIFLLIAEFLRDSNDMETFRISNKKDVFHVTNLGRYLTIEISPKINHEKLPE